MGAIKLDIDTYRPILDEKSIELLMKRVESDLDALRMDDGYSLFEYECLNGITIHLEVRSGGCSYRNIQFSHLYVMYKEGSDEEYTSIPEYEERLTSLICERIQDLNYKEEECYELENAY